MNQHVKVCFILLFSLAALQTTLAGILKIDLDEVSEMGGENLPPTHHSQYHQYDNTQYRLPIPVYDDLAPIFPANFEDEVHPVGSKRGFTSFRYRPEWMDNKELLDTGYGLLAKIKGMVGEPEGSNSDIQAMARSKMAKLIDKKTKENLSMSPERLQALHPKEKMEQLKKNVDERVRRLLESRNLGMLIPKENRVDPHAENIRKLMRLQRVIVGPKDAYNSH